MNKTFMIATSALALFAAMPSMAETNNVDKPYVETTTEAEVDANIDAAQDTVSDAWEGTKDAVSDAAETVSDATSKTYDETKALMDTHADIDAYIESDNRVTAEKLMGESLFNQNGDKVATVSDVAINTNGKIAGFVVTHGGLMGLAGKDIYVDYQTLVKRDAKDGYTTAMTEDNIKQYPKFAETQLKKGVYLGSDLLDSDIVNPAMDDLAEVDDIVIENGTATKLVVSYMDGLMSKKAMIDFSDADIVKKDDHTSFELSMNESVEFKNYISR